MSVLLRPLRISPGRYIVGDQDHRIVLWIPGLQSSISPTIYSSAPETDISLISRSKHPSSPPEDKRKNPRSQIIFYGFREKSAPVFLGGALTNLSINCTYGIAAIIRQRMGWRLWQFAYTVPDFGRICFLPGEQRENVFIKIGGSGWPEPP